MNNNFGDKLKKAIEDSQAAEKGKVVIKKGGSPFMLLVVLLALAKFTVAPTIGWGVVLLPIWLPLAIGASVLAVVVILLLIALGIGAALSR